MRRLLQACLANCDQADFDCEVKCDKQVAECVAPCLCYEKCELGCDHCNTAFCRCQMDAPPEKIECEDESEAIYIVYRHMLKKWLWMFRFMWARKCRIDKSMPMQWAVSTWMPMSWLSFPINDDCCSHDYRRCQTKNQCSYTQHGHHEKCTVDNWCQWTWRYKRFLVQTRREHSSVPIVLAKFRRPHLCVWRLWRNDPVVNVSFSLSNLVLVWEPVRARPIKYSSVSVAAITKRVALVRVRLDRLPRSIRASTSIIKSALPRVVVSR